MAARTIETGIDVDSALTFLGKQSKPQVSGEEYFQARIQEIITKALTDSDNQRFSLVTALMNDKDKAKSISQLKELLGV